jgi:predicted O-methyltransferase YrrM
MFIGIFEYIKYLIKARNAFGIHAPFAYDFYTNVIRAEVTIPEDIIEVENIRKSLLKSPEMILVCDFGTGASKNKRMRKVSDIAHFHSNSPKDAYLLYRMIQFLKPATIIELGTSLGFSTIYMAKAAERARLYTIEGCPETARLAKQNFKTTGVDVNLYAGNIDQRLPELLTDVRPEFVFFDGNHTKEATLHYFELCLQHADEKAVFVFDDIYWSAGMKDAWCNIIAHPQVNLSLDLFRLGIVFLKKNSAKQHFVLKY